MCHDPDCTLRSALWACREESTKSDKLIDVINDHTRHTQVLIRPLSMNFLSFSSTRSVSLWHFFFSFSLAHAYTHHCHTRTRHGRKRTGGAPAISPWRPRRARRTAADRVDRHPPGRRSLHNTRIASRHELPRLFKFTLTVQSAYRWTPAAAYTAPTICRCYSYKSQGPACVHSMFIWSATRRHRSAPLASVVETVKMANAVTWPATFYDVSLYVKGLVDGQWRLLHIITWPSARVRPMREVLP